MSTNSISASAKGCRFEGVDGLAVDVERQPGVRNAGYRQRGVLAQYADRLAHVLGPGGAIQTYDVDGQALEDGQGGMHIGAKQHATGGVEGDLGLDGEVDLRLFEGPMAAGDDGADLEDVLRGLDDEHVHATPDEADGLFAEDIHEIIEGDVGQLRVIGGGQLAGRANGAGHEARLPGSRRVLVGQFAGQRGADLVDLDDSILQAVLLHRDAIGAEGVGLDDIHADLKE